MLVTTYLGKETLPKLKMTSRRVRLLREGTLFLLSVEHPSLAIKAFSTVTYQL